MVDEPESSDSMRTFGAVIQAPREHVGLSREEFAEQVRYSKHTVASVELGRRMPDPAFVERAEEVLGNTGALRRAACHLARQPGLAAWFRQWARLEREAITLYTYECRMIPGLLQTEAYARVLFSHQLPPLDDAQIEERWAARGDRQRLPEKRPNTAFSFILEEHPSPPPPSTSATPSAGKGRVSPSPPPPGPPSSRRLPPRGRPPT